MGDTHHYTHTFWGRIDYFRIFIRHWIANHPLGHCSTTCTPFRGPSLLLMNRSHFSLTRTLHRDQGIFLHFSLSPIHQPAPRPMAQSGKLSFALFTHLPLAGALQTPFNVRVAAGPYPWSTLHWSAGQLRVRKVQPFIGAIRHKLPV